MRLAQQLAHSPLLSTTARPSTHTCSQLTPPNKPRTQQTENGYLLLYDLHVTKHPALPQLRSQAWGPNTGHDASAALHTVDVYVKHPVRCDRDVPATCLCCDSRVILVAYADGYWGSCSWSGKVGVTVGGVGGG